MRRLYRTNIDECRQRVEELNHCDGSGKDLVIFIGYRFEFQHPRSSYHVFTLQVVSITFNLATDTEIIELHLANGWHGRMAEFIKYMYHPTSL